jgi:lipid-A-disaccharide synthase
MVNILAGKQVVPELIQSDFTAAKVAGGVKYLLDHPQAREAMRQELRALKDRLGPGGAIGRAADAVAGVLLRGSGAQGVRSQESGVRMATPPVG